MKTKWLVCLLISFLLGAGLYFERQTKTHDLPPTAKEYLELIQQVQDLSTSAEEWNNRCSGPPFSKDCLEDQKVMNDLWSKYVIRAIKYKEPGTDHYAVMRVKIINFNIQIGLFNMKCAGQDQTPLQQAECKAESDFIEQEREGLHIQIMVDTEDKINPQKQEKL
jgi:hypothetical protein